MNDISAQLLFFALELNRIDDEEMARKLADERLAHYRPWIEYRRSFRPHQLSDEVERLLHDKAVVGRNAWTRLFDETWAQFRFTVGGDEMNSDEVLNLMAHKDGRVRKEAAKAFARTLSQNIQTFALATNTLIKDKEIEDRWRGYARRCRHATLSNQVEDEVVDALIDSVREAYPRLSHRYYRLKARLLGMDKLNYWDRNAALPTMPTATSRGARRARSSLTPMARFHPPWPTLLTGSSKMAGFTRRLPMARRRGRFPTRPCHQRTLTCC